MAPAQLEGRLIFDRSFLPDKTQRKQHAQILYSPHTIRNQLGPNSRFFVYSRKLQFQLFDEPSVIFQHSIAKANALTY